MIEMWDPTTGKFPLDTGDFTFSLKMETDLFCLAKVTRASTTTTPLPGDTTHSTRRTHSAAICQRRGRSNNSRRGEGSADPMSFRKEIGK